MKCVNRVTTEMDATKPLLSAADLLFERIMSISRTMQGVAEFASSELGVLVSLFLVM